MVLCSKYRTQTHCYGICQQLQAILHTHSASAVCKPQYTECVTDTAAAATATLTDEGLQHNCITAGSHTKQSLTQFLTVMMYCAWLFADVA